MATSKLRVDVPRLMERLRAIREADPRVKAEGVDYPPTEEMQQDVKGFLEGESDELNDRLQKHLRDKKRCSTGEP